MVADGWRDAEYRLQEERRDADEQQEVVQLGDGLGVDVEARDLAVGERRDARQQHQQRQLRHGVHRETHVNVPPMRQSRKQQELRSDWTRYYCEVKNTLLEVL